MNSGVLFLPVNIRSFSLLVQPSTVSISHNAVSHASVGEHLGSFSVEAISNTAVMKSCSCLYECMFSFLLQTTKDL